MGFNIRQKQSDVLLRAINLNSSSSSSNGSSAAAPGGAGADPGDLYKVLVLDRFTKDVVAPLLRVNELRRNGVTLHLMLEAERQPIPDVPAVYLVQPTQANAERIVADAAAGLYESMHLNFSSSLPPRLLEALASGMVKQGGSQRVAKLFDQYLAFIAMEPSLFSLGLPSSYVELNDPAARDTQIEAAVGQIVDGLFSVCVTLGVVPIIRCPRGGAAEAVASQLDQRLRDAIKARNNLFAEGVMGLAATLARPLLCLFDRNFDLAAALQHAWTYKPLVHDVLGMRLNRITLAAADAAPAGGIAGPKQASRSYDVDDRDFFWESCGAYPFPRVAEEVESQLQKYKAAVDAINRQSAAGAAEGVYVDPDELLRRNTHSLMAAVSSLPELQEQKRTLDKHTNLATSLLAAIKARGLDGWHNGCEDVMCGKADLAAVLKLVGGPRGTPADRLRLAIIWLLAYDGLPSDTDMADLEAALAKAGADITALTYVRTLKRNNLIGAQKGALADGLQGLSAGAQGASSQAALFDWADKTLGNVTKSVKTLLSGARQPPLVTTVEALAEGRPGTPEFDTYAVFDPKAPAGRAGLDRAKGAFKEVIVFMIGGGSYAERESLVAWASRGGAAGMGAGSGGVGAAGAQGMGGRALIYGATDILQGQELLAQLAELGRRCGVGPGGIERAPAGAAGF